MKVGTAVLGALGGAGVVAAVVAKFVSEHASQKWLQENQALLDRAAEVQRAGLERDADLHRATLSKEAEVHKLTLRRNEILFEREIAAADALMAVWDKVWPKYSRPNMDLHEAREDVAVRLGEVEDTLEEFLRRHSVAISPTVRDCIDSARIEAATEKFFNDGPDQSPPRASVDAADRVLTSLAAAKETILADLRR